jgi:hypothetical protein
VGEQPDFPLPLSAEIPISARRGRGLFNLLNQITHFGKTLPLTRKPERSACQWVCAKAVIAEPKGCRRHIAKVAASALFVGEPFYRPKTGHPVDHCAEREGHIAHLNMILGLLRAREQARGQ